MLKKTAQIPNYLFPILFLFVGFFISVHSSCYHKKIISKTHYKGGVWLSENHFVVFRSIHFFRHAKGIAAFPDGGISKQLHRHVALFEVDMQNNRPKMLHDFGKWGNSPYRWEGHISLADSALLYSMQERVYGLEDGYGYSGIFLLNLKTGEHTKIADKGRRAALSPCAQEIAFLFNSHVFIYNIQKDSMHRVWVPVDYKPAYLEWGMNSDSLFLMSMQQNRIYHKKKNDFVPTDRKFAPNYGQDRIPFDELKQIPDSSWGHYLHNNKIIIQEK